MSVLKSCDVVSRDYVISLYWSKRIDEGTECCKAAFGRSISSDDIFNATWRSVFNGLAIRPSRYTMSIQHTAMLWLRRLIRAKAVLEQWRPRNALSSGFGSGTIVAKSRRCPSRLSK